MKIELINNKYEIYDKYLIMEELNNKNDVE